MIEFESDIKLILSEGIINDLKECNKKSAPVEACGLIFGKVNSFQISEDNYQVHYIGKQFYCLKSNIESVSSFNLIKDTDKYYEIHDDAVNKKGLRLISIFHSHPAPAYPSSIDIENMKYLDKDVGKIKNPFKNQIWSIMNMKSEKLNGFIYYNGSLLQVDLQIQKE